MTASNLRQTYVHPFPARMAPELATRGLEALSKSAVILDPMMGSGTVIRQACTRGNPCIGFDIDPLAVLMASVWTSPVRLDLVEQLAEEAMDLAKSTRASDIYLPWIDEDAETKKFVDYWFASPQKRDLRKLASALDELGGRRYRADKRAALDVLRVSLSRIIITKDAGASLARDVSHSRPHRVADNTDYDVFAGFDRSVRFLSKRLAEFPIVRRNASVSRGDARSLDQVKAGSVDAVITSPPYLNAIDYMRGHRLALIWLGYELSNLRLVRSNSIGAERAADDDANAGHVERIVGAMAKPSRLEKRHLAMVRRYAGDAYKTMSEMARVLRKQGSMTMVIGNSCLKGQFVDNAEGFIEAGRRVGLELTRKTRRRLPPQSRYLPPPSKRQEPLSARMRSEVVVEFVKR